MRRRDFVALIAASLTLSESALGQQVRRPFRVAHVSINSLETRRHLNDALELGLREQGYTIGKDLVIEQAAGDGTEARLKELVRETVASNPDVIVTGANNVTLAVKAATERIPIVMAIGLNVVDNGFAQSLRRPGGNITGVTIDVGNNIWVKHIELIKELRPGVKRFCVLWEPPSERSRVDLDMAAAAAGVAMPWIKFSGDLERDFAEMQRVRCDAVMMFTGTQVYRRAREATALALRLRLPSTWGVSDYVNVGGLMSYGPNQADLYRRAARHVDQILKGAKPSDLPIEQPALIDLEINLNTAKALGIVVPQLFLLRATRVIE